MSVLEFLLLLLVAAICGAMGQALTGYSRGGCLVAAAVGFVGAVLGTWLGRQLGLSEILAVNIGGTSFPIIWSIIGSALFVGVLAMLTRR